MSPDILGLATEGVALSVDWGLQGCWRSVSCLPGLWGKGADTRESGHTRRHAQKPCLTWAAGGGLLGGRAPRQTAKTGDAGAGSPGSKVTRDKGLASRNHPSSSPITAGAWPEIPQNPPEAPQTHFLRQSQGWDAGCHPPALQIQCGPRPAGAARQVRGPGGIHATTAQAQGCWRVTLSQAPSHFLCPFAPPPHGGHSARLQSQHHGSHLGREAPGTLCPRTDGRGGRKEIPRATRPQGPGSREPSLRPPACLPARTSLPLSPLRRWALGRSGLYDLPGAGAPLLTTSRERQNALQVPPQTCRGQGRAGT